MPAWSLPTHQPLQAQPCTTGLAPNPALPQGSKSTSQNCDMGVSTVPLPAEIQIPATPRWGGTFVMHFNPNASIAQSKDLAAPVLWP